MAIKNLNRIHPIFIDAASQEITAAGALPVNETSFIKVAPASADTAYTVADGTFVGQTVVVANVGAGNDANITLATPFDADLDVIALDANGEHVTIMWTGTFWIVLGDGAASIA